MSQLSNPFNSLPKSVLTDLDYGVGFRFLLYHVVPMHWRLKEWCRYGLYTMILLVIAKVASWDLPIVMGCVIVDAMDPNKPGRMMGVVISPWERLTEVVIVGLCVWGIVKLNKSYKQP